MSMMSSICPSVFVVGLEWIGVIVKVSSPKHEVGLFPILDLIVECCDPSCNRQETLVLISHHIWKRYSQL
jgi:hypothetical protein